MARKEKEYIIVKHAGDDWSFYFYNDPKKGTTYLNSAYYSSTGKDAGIEAIYTDRQKAEQDCDKISICNPCGNYAVCQVND